MVRRGRVQIPALVALLASGVLLSCGGDLDRSKEPVMNASPVADAGDDQRVTESGLLVALDGNGSIDPDGDSLAYEWAIIVRPAGSTAMLSSAVVSKPTFTPDKAGMYRLRLVVSDGRATSSPDRVTIMVGMPPPDTGQSQRYSVVFGDDGDYTINPPSYRDNGDGTVLDRVTRLTWQKCTVGLSGMDCAEGSPILYNWYEASGTADQWDNPGGEVDVCGDLKLAGTGWRLPTPVELISIVDFGAGSPAINSAVFPNTEKLNGPYWTSTLGEPFWVFSAWCVMFHDGQMVGCDLLFGEEYVRCVR